MPGDEPGRTLWRHRNFLLLWSGQTVSEMGSAVTQLALPLTAVVVLRASTFEVGLLVAAATLAFAGSGWPAGGCTSPPCAGCPQHGEWLAAVPRPVPRCDWFRPSGP